MKIALAILHADPGRGGAERYTVDLARALTRRGHAVSLLASTGPDTIPQLVRLDAPGRSRLARYRAFQRAVALHRSTHPYDVVHAMLPLPGCDVYHPHAGIEVQAVRTGSRWSRWGNRFNRRRQETAAVERLLLSGSQPPVVLCLSDYLKQTLVRHYPRVPASQLVRLFNGTDLQRFDPVAAAPAGLATRHRLGFTDDDVIALMIAQDFERKGLPQTLQAFARVLDDRLKLVVVGKQNPARYRAAAERLGIARRVIFAGPTSDPISFYAASDFFILPTRHDPCSLVVLEALAMGVPVISTVRNGACEVIQPGIQGVVLDDPDDVNGLTDALQQMLDRQRRATMHHAALALRPSLSHETHLDTLESAYRLARSNRRAVRSDGE